MLALLASLNPLSGALAQSCEPPAARLVSIQGSVDVRRDQQSTWEPVALESTLCPGDSLRVLAAGRAALVMPDQTVTRLGEDTTVTFRRPPAGAERTWLNVLRGVIHVITRQRDALRVETPFANAGIEGTEFLVRVTAVDATVEVLEGAVKVDGVGGDRATASADRKVTAATGTALVGSATDRSGFRRSVQWALYYPPVGTGAAGGVARAREALVVGRVAEATAELDAVLAADPDNAEALALRATVALAQGEGDAARDFATRAVAAAPQSSAALLARSYVEQAEFQVEQALATLQEAAVVDSANALVEARLAELRLAVGDTSGAVETAERAVAADQGLALPRTVLGFALLARVQTAAARERFREAIERDSAAPLPRLGLGLALIRDGELAAGREQIEIAVLLDPGNALLRSYAGKAYYEEKRDTLAATQLQIARELDPNDPTPWFYDAIRKQTVNRPADALVDLHESIAMNDNRAVYRSQLLLDDDAAARNASVAAIYNDLGFETLAVLAGTDGLAENFGNFSAHRLLADAYEKRPRYDVARVSEALQAQIRQPLYAPPVDLVETTDNLAILRAAGPTRVGINEYNPLFEREQLRVQADAILGSRDTRGDQFGVSGLEDNLAFSVGQLHYETDGYTANNAAEKDVYDAFLQIEASPATTWQLNARRTELELGNTFFAFDPTFEFPTEIGEQADTLRLNGRHAPRPDGDIVWSVVYEDRDRDVHYTPLDIPVTRTEAQTWSAELQRVDRLTDFHLVSGVSMVTDHQDFPMEGENIESFAGTGYAYLNWRPPAGALALTAGLAMDFFEQELSAFNDEYDRTHISPKLGLMWTGQGGTTLRAAAFESVRRPLIRSQSIEPTTVVGFNQFFAGFDNLYGDPEGALSQRVAVAIDQAFGGQTYAGLEASLRDLEVLVFQDDTEATVHWREKSGRAYWYRALPSEADAWLPPGWNAAISLSGELDTYSRPARRTGPEAYNELDIWRFPVGLLFTTPSGWTLRTVVTYTKQETDFQIETIFPVVVREEDGWVTDVFVEFRLPDRFGIVSLGVRNAFDSRITIFETDPLSARTAGRRQIIGTISLTS